MRDLVFDIKTATEPKYDHVHELIEEHEDILDLSDVLPRLSSDFLEDVIGVADLTAHGYYQSTVICADCEEPIELDTKYVEYQKKPYCPDCWKLIHEDLTAEEETDE